MQKIIITYDIGNSAFSDIIDIKERLKISFIDYIDNGFTKIRDLNGNVVGSIEEEAIK